MITWPKSKIEAIKTLKKLPSEHLLLFTNSFSSALIGKLAGKKALGFATDGRSWLLNTAIKKPKNQHETDIFNYLTAQCLNTWFPKVDYGIFSNTPILKMDADLNPLRQKHHLPEQYIVLCPFAHGTNPEGKPKKWPNWQELSHQINKLNPIICPGPNELSEAEEIFPHVQKLPKLSLSDYLQILSHAELIIANDSGPMHMACAVNKPTIAIFGATDEKRTGPYNAFVLGKAGFWPSVDEVLQQIEILLTNTH